MDGLDAIDEALPDERTVEAEVTAAGRALRPHGGNDNGRKLATLGLFLIWGILTIGMAGFGWKTPEMYTPLTLLLGIILGKMWEIEYERLMAAASGSPASISSADRDEDESR